MAETDADQPGESISDLMGRGWTEDEVRRYFDQTIADLKAGAADIAVCGGMIRPHRLDSETLSALIRYAENPTPQILTAAYEELERQLDGTHRAEAQKAIDEIARRLWPEPEPATKVQRGTDSGG